MRCLTWAQCPYGSVACWVHNCSMEGYKLVKVKPQAIHLEDQNRLALESETKLVGTGSGYITLLRVIADVMDLAAGGLDTWCAIGRTQNGSSLTFTLVVDGTRETYYIVSLEELCEALKAAL